MIAIILIGILAATVFRNMAQNKGYNSPKIWILPLALTGIILGATLGISSLGRVLVESDQAREFQNFISTILGITIQIIILTKIWYQIKKMRSKK